MKLRFTPHNLKLPVPPMRVRCLSTLKKLAPYAEDWERLAAGVPFRSWTWLQHWWRQYGPEHSPAANSRLAVVCIFDARALIGIAPWYFEHTTVRGRTLRPLGSGEICSDYLGVLCQPGREEVVAGTLADYLVTNAQDDDPDALHWDLLHLDGVDAEDHVVSLLSHCLAISGCSVHRKAGLSCWRLELPASWEEYIDSLSKNLRRDARRLERDLLDTNRAVLHSIERLDDLPRAMDVLVDLHQRRRRMLGEGGCFASERFLGFYREVLPDLFRQGKLKFYWLEIDGEPAAAEFQLVGGGVLFDYQTGVAPEAMDHQPGKLLNLMIIRRAIAEGYRALDFLRGDEPYKARFGAQPRPSLEYRVAPPRPVAQIRHNLWLAGNNVKEWIKKGIE